MTTYEEKDTDHGCTREDQELFERIEERDDSSAQSDVVVFPPKEDIGQGSSDPAAGYMKLDGNDQSLEKAGAPVATRVQKLDSIDKRSSSGPTNISTSECLSDLPGPAHRSKLPPSERYKPRPPINFVPTRPSLSRSSTTCDSRPIDDSERRSLKRVSFQQAPTPLYTPPSTTTSSPVSSSASPRLPFRTTFAKPPAVSIPPGQYTPVASSSSVSPSSPTTFRKTYACLEPTCDNSFDHSYDRDRHERQHQIGDPPYSRCPICHHSRSSGAVLDVGLREVLIAHMNRRH